MSRPAFTRCKCMQFVFSSLFFLGLALCPAACNSQSGTSRDLSNFDDFRMGYFYTSKPCACVSDCPIDTHIVRQADGIYRVEFEDSSRNLTSNETAQLKELFASVEFANTLLACIAGTAAQPNCPTYLSWDSLDASSSASATNAPCMLGADPLTTEQANSIMAFMARLEAANGSP